MKQHLDINEAWKKSIRRYQIASVIGLLMCIVFFTMLYRMPADTVPPLWMLWGTGFGGLFLLGGLFGLGMSYFLRALHK